MCKVEVRHKLLIIDGHNFLFRYFWGMPRTIFSSDGQPIHGAFGFIASLIKHLRRFEPDYVVVCFDAQTTSERTELLPAYKANRIKAFEPGSADNPFSQLEAVQSALQYMEIPSVELPYIEADDVIGSYTFAAQERGNVVIIASSDKDYIQLVNDSTSVFNKRGEKEFIFTPEKVREEFHIEPTQYIDYKALMGDQSDNIKGVPGIGPKTAANLLKSYTSLDGIYSHVHELRGSLRARLIEHQELVIINQKVIKIDTNIPVNLRIFDSPALSFDKEASVRKVFTKIGLFT